MEIVVDMSMDTGTRQHENVIYNLQFSWKALAEVLSHRSFSVPVNPRSVGRGLGRGSVQTS